jgi:ornithine carbamoyltransferase
MNILSIFDSSSFLLDLLDRAKEMKKSNTRETLKNKTLGLLFERASTRTRISFEVAMTQLGGHSVYINPEDTQIGRGESIKDTALTLSRYLDAIAVRPKTHKSLVGLSNHSTIPVINALTELEHPCQVLSDLFTIREKKGGFDIKLAYIGDGNNVCNSLIGGSALVDMEIAVATPKGREPDEGIVRKSKKMSPDSLSITNDPLEAIKSAEVIYTDVWVSMGQERREQEKIKDFVGFQVNEDLLKTSNNALVMHCLPAKRGLEITDSVLDGPNSIVFDQAENRLHVQKALLEMVIR